MIHVENEKEGDWEDVLLAKCKTRLKTLNHDTWNLWVIPNCVTNPAWNLLVQVCATSFQTFTSHNERIIFKVIISEAAETLYFLGLWLAVHLPLACGVSVF